MANTLNKLSLLEVMRRTAPHGDELTIAEVLNEENEILKDVVWTEANGDLYEKQIQRMTLPTGNKRRFNRGVPLEVTQTREVTAGVDMQESFSEVDEKLVAIAPNGNALRMSESRAFIEGMGQTFVRSLFYNAKAGGDEYDGIATILNNTALPLCESGGGVSGDDLSSIYVVSWGIDKAYCFYPRNSKTAGVQHTDLGLETKDETDPQGVRRVMRVYRDQFQMNSGLMVKDTRAVARIANVKVDGTFDEDILIRLLNRMRKAGKDAVIYVSPGIKTLMDIKAKDKTNVNYNTTNLWGEPTMAFRGVPVRVCEAILETEAFVPNTPLPTPIP